MSRYVIIGGGAVGATLAAELHRTGIDTVLIARGAQLDALRAQGLAYVRPDGEHRLRPPVAGGPSEITLTDTDVLVLATKTTDSTAAVADWAWQPVKRADGSTGVAATTLPLVTLQNGLETERIALRSFATVIGAVVWVPATFVTPGQVVNHGSPVPAILWLGRYPHGRHPVAAAVAADLHRAGFIAHQVDDITGHKAGKLISNLVNSLDALYPPSPLRDAATKALRTEARAVYAAAGIVPIIPDGGDFQPVGIPGHERAGNSTRQSLTRSAVPETDYLDGEIVLLARLHGVPAPLAEAVVARVHRAVTEATPALSLTDADLATTLPTVAGTLPAAGDPAASGSDGGAGRPGSSREAVLVTVDEVRRFADGTTRPVLLDVRWALGDPHGAEHYRDGHLPGAVYADLDTELAGGHAPGAGRHPLPAVEDLQAAARRWGINRDSAVVVYDNSGGLAAARAWWLLRWAGVSDVRILDGGLAAWKAAGHSEETGTPTPRPAGDVVLSAGHLPTLTADEAAALPAAGTLLDARAGERYRGETEPIDPRAGHIPGAINRPTGGNLRDGVPYFRAEEELRERFAGLTGPIGVYCGSGVTAAHQIAALATLGIEAALYPGSWSAWSSDPDRPAATGEQP
ncbi:MAG TPA: rhodanese-like domain-containing protein [Actinoplanes sp.]|nr:rhodanese-like domain-containing protein [Actinoplanes sp.]